jgi:hypothetical protein
MLWRFEIISLPANSGLLKYNRLGKLLKCESRYSKNVCVEMFTHLPYLESVSLLAISKYWKMEYPLNRNMGLNKLGPLENILSKNSEWFLL